jgi:hypothetical protein
MPGITLLTEITLLADNGFQQVGVERSKLGRHLRSRRRLFRQLRDMFQLIGFRSHGGWSNECISRGNRLKARRACSRVVGFVVFVRRLVVTTRDDAVVACCAFNDLGL